MNTSHERESAKIFAFPAGGRAGLAARRIESRPTAEIAPRADIAWGGSWYHEEAVRDERSPKR
ncbi:DUF2735 domain-containing protein [Ancylobacter mangrovi]|uniref:DUF2735 domain-containing protein n=1 Tax=Ancylobacter mangrovi TaxID=2972472 RepID=A0A9X2PIE8_9HYPH|nr:DUF2735 domain-containing protein [Ancylobacter mangrovi]MCS0495842.1 DUF2735 domain-containing protein [Ancylobacter mangrovi]MCS0502718.1 DUF2735 domain-containing protein [Ancylobacter mangrovi]